MTIKASHLRTSRTFPKNPQALSVEIYRAYIETANAINAKVEGVFPTFSPAETGEKWFESSEPFNSLRQFYTFTAAGNIPHNIIVSDIQGFTRIYGTFTDGTDWYPLPWVDEVMATNQISLKVTPTNIVITAGALLPPTITKGFVVLEWLVK